MDPLEIEVKFWVPDPEGTRERILSTGARLVKSRVFEVNHRYDDPEERLRKKKVVLRLRKDRTATLTVKSTPSGETNPDFKIHTELEVGVDDFETTDRILKAIGFRKQQSYEKWRETFSLEGTEIVMDTLPFGHFMEIEGAQAAIRKVSALLGLDWERRILMSYLALFEQIKKSHGLAFSDITFDNFKEVSFDPAFFKAPFS